MSQTAVIWVVIGGALGILVGLRLILVARSTPRCPVIGCDYRRPCPDHTRFHGELP